MKALSLLIFWTFATFTWAASADSGLLNDLVLEPHPGERLPLASWLTDETGHSVSLGRYFDRKPVVLVLDYLRCRTICGVALGGLAQATAAPSVVGHDYAVLAISIDPRDTPADAAAAKAKYAGAQYGTWHFLTGSETAVRPIADAVGFHYRYDAAGDQYIHSAGIVVAAPDGTIAGYLADLDITPNSFAAAIDAVKSGSNPGTLTRLLLLCFGHAAQVGRYTAAIEAALVCLNLAGMLTAFALFAWVRRRRHD